MKPISESLNLDKKEFKISPQSSNTKTKNQLHAVTIFV